MCGGLSWPASHQHHRLTQPAGAAARTTLEALPHEHGGARMLHSSDCPAGLAIGLAVITLMAPLTDQGQAPLTQPTVSQDQVSCENHGSVWDSKKKPCASGPCVNSGK